MFWSGTEGVKSEIWFVGIFLLLAESAESSKLIPGLFCTPEEICEMSAVLSSGSESHIMTENHRLPPGLAGHSWQSPQHLLRPVAQPKQD